LIFNRIRIIIFGLGGYASTSAGLYLGECEFHQQRVGRESEEPKANRPKDEAIDAKTSIRIRRNNQEFLEQIFSIPIEEGAD
jgi:hypothetical protein